MVVQFLDSNQRFNSRDHLLRWCFLLLVFILIVLWVVVSYILCMSTNKLLYIIGGTLVIVSYGFAAPTAAAIISV